MDVRCERCRAQYVFDDAQVTETGLTVKCSNCGHLFKVKKKALVVTVPLKPGEATETPITAKMPAAGGIGAATGAPAPAVTPAPATTPPGSPLPSDRREWRVRQGNGNVFTFKELTTLQTWIVEKKVSRDDEISLSGDQWKRLGNIAELATFFQVVEAAERGQSAPPPALTPLPMPPVYPGTGAYPPGYPPGYAPQVPGYPPTTPVPFQPGVSPPVTGSIRVNAVGPAGAAWESQPPSAPRAAAPDPAWTRAGRRALPDAELDAEDLKAVKGSGGKVALLLFLLVVGGGVAAVYLKPELLVTLGLKAPPAPPQPVVQAPPPGKPEPPPVVQALPPAKPEPPPVPAPEPPKAEPPRPEPQPVVEKAPEMVKDPPQPQPRPPPKGAKQMLAEARKLRERGKMEKALDLYGRVAELQPDNPEALAGRGWCYLDLSQYSPAEASFQAALQEEPTHAEALIGLAETYRYQGRRPEAVAYYQKYLAAHPNGEDAVAARNALGQLKE